MISAAAASEVAGRLGTEVLGLVRRPGCQRPQLPEMPRATAVIQGRSMTMRTAQVA